LWNKGKFNIQAKNVRNGEIIDSVIQKISDSGFGQVGRIDVDAGVVSAYYILRIPGIQNLTNGGEQSRGIQRFFQKDRRS